MTFKRCCSIIFILICTASDAVSIVGCSDTDKQKIKFYEEQKFAQEKHDIAVIELFVEKSNQLSYLIDDSIKYGYSTELELIKLKVYVEYFSDLCEKEKLAGHEGDSCLSLKGIKPLLGLFNGSNYIEEDEITTLKEQLKVIRSLYTELLNLSKEKAAEFARAKTNELTRKLELINNGSIVLISNAELNDTDYKSIVFTEHHNYEFAPKIKFTSTTIERSKKFIGEIVSVLNP